MIQSLCPACGAPLDSGTKYCSQCGHALAAGAAPAPSDPLRTALELGLRAQYGIVRLLGQGGMGSVYLAREGLLERLVAIKVIRPEVANDPSARERFLKEARTGARLAHPNIVPLHAFGEVEGMLYLVMGYIHGEPLSARLRRDGKLPPEDVRRLLCELADGLDYAHRQGIVHRDIKPDNVLLDDDSGRPMITDFGLAKGHTAGAMLTRTGQIFGTPHYMSPEQWTGDRAIDGRSDLYSLGVMGYAMLAGRLPFDGDTVPALMAQHMTHEPVLVSTLVVGVPDDLSLALARCLAKNPAERWPDGKSLKEALGRATPDDPDALSGDLRQVSGWLFWILAAGWAALTAWVAFGDHGLGMGLGFGVALTFGFLVVAIANRRKGAQWRQIARVAVWPPKWWPFGWLGKWRRPGDVWSRLPSTLRRVRLFNGWILTLWLLAVPVMLWRHANRIEWLYFISGLALLATTGRMICVRWARRNNFPNNADLVEVAAGSTSNARFWKQPHVARILLPVPTPGSRVQHMALPATTSGLLSAIIDVERQLPRPMGTPGGKAVTAARQLAGTIEQLDIEIESIAQNSDPADVIRLEGRLEALDGNAATASDEQRQVRRLLEEQLELMRRFEARVAQARQRRDHLIELLRQLWVQLAAIQAQGTAGTDPNGTPNAIGSVYAEIDRQTSAMSETQTM